MPHLMAFLGGEMTNPAAFLRLVEQLAADPGESGADEVALVNGKVL